MRKWHNPQSRGYSCVEKKISRVRSCGNDINLSLAEFLAMKKNCSISRLFTCIWSQYSNTIYLAFVHAEMTQSTVSWIFSRRKKKFITHSFMRKSNKSQSRGNSRNKKTALSCICSGTFDLSPIAVLPSTHRLSCWGRGGLSTMRWSSSMVTTPFWPWRLLPALLSCGITLHHLLRLPLCPECVMVPCSLNGQ